jgi:folate-binding protein YgfZ
MPQSSLEQTHTIQYANKLKNNGIIQIRGEERAKYLQGQITANINELNDNNALLACHCNFKGKTWSVFFTFAWQDSILLVTHNSVLKQSLSELNKYGVFAKVDISDQSDSWRIIGGSGDLFEGALQDLFDELPTSDRSVISNSNGLVMSVEHPEQRYLIIQPNNAKKLLSCDISEDSNQWEIADIKAGLGDIRASTVDEYVPQMLNLQALNAIDFEKGCYMGQEVVARTKYLGRNKRAGFILKTDSTTDDLSGEQLEYQVGENWRPGGKILRSGADADHTWIFAVLAKDTEIGAAFRVKSTQNLIFVTQALPYPLQ